MRLPMRPIMASSLWTWVWDAKSIAKRAAATNTNNPIKNAWRRIRTLCGASIRRRMKSEIGPQFFPKPIGKWTLLYRGSVGGDEGLGFIHAPVQAVQIREQECVIGIKGAAIFYVLQQLNRFVDLSLRQRSCHQVGHDFQRWGCETLRDPLGN